MSKIKAWIGAMRLRTLPLSLSGIIMGSALAGFLGHWDSCIFFAAISTTVLFQILSNLANDLGDSQKGTDNSDRLGPMRAVQSGEISIREMKRGVGITVVLSFVSAASLIYLSLPNLSESLLVFYAVLAIVCVLAAMLYTLGKWAYGYSGFGDVVVFLFFGVVSVLGVFSLYGLSFEWLTILPALTIGLWSAAVLNLNNMRDIENDRAFGKKTLVVKMGFEKSKYYHVSLILIGFSAWAFLICLFVFISYNGLYLIALVPSLFIYGHLKNIFSFTNNKSFDGELKKVALLTFFSALLFSAVLFLNG